MKKISFLLKRGAESRPRWDHEEMIEGFEDVPEAKTVKIAIWSLSRGRGFTQEALYLPYFMLDALFDNIVEIRRRQLLDTNLALSNTEVKLADLRESNEEYENAVYEVCDWDTIEKIQEAHEIRMKKLRDEK